MRHPIVESVKNLIREPHAWPGGYQKSLVMSDGCLLCPTCAKENFALIVSATKDGRSDGWKAEAVDVYWEGPAEQCAHCNKDINSEYGDPACESAP